MISVINEDVIGGEWSRLHCIQQKWEIGCNSNEISTSKEINIVNKFYCDIFHQPKQTQNNERIRRNEWSNNIVLLVEISDIIICANWKIKSQKLIKINWSKMDINMERDSGVIGTLFQQIINDMKVSEKRNIRMHQVRATFPSRN